jgi:hypothetical protein
MKNGIFLKRPCHKRGAFTYYLLSVPSAAALRSGSGISGIALFRRHIMLASVQRRLCVLAFVVAAPALCAAPAQAGQRWGAVVLQNNSDVTLTFQMRLGTEGDWTDYTVPPKTNYAVEFALDRRGRAYTPYIRFDTSKQTTRTYSLEFYEVDGADPQKGKPYKFVYDENTGWDLFKAD